ncbi:MAG TPA: hypothetical protein PLU35_12650 [Phycisphaerales bacterium]|nr:hypothetical protein [Phycisphaerales bacterium]
MRSVLRGYGIASSLEWWATQRSRHLLFISAEVLRELTTPGFRHGDAALRLIEGVASLAFDEDVLGLASLLVAERVMPGPAAGGDAMHVAVATAHRVEYLLSWNVRHLANPNKLVHLRRVCLRAGLVPPQIITPDLLWESTP